VHVLFKSKVLCCGKGHLRSGDTLYCRVVCQVDKEYGTVDSTGLFKGFDEVVGLLECNTHSGKYYGERLCRADYLSLTCNLSSQLRMRQTGCGEDRKLLSTNQGVQTVDSGYTGLDELFRICTGCRVHRKTVYVTAFLRKDFRTTIDRTAHTIEYTGKHIFRYAQLHGATQETNLGTFQVQACGNFEKLYQCILAIDFKDFTTTSLAVGKFDFT